jgi:hypothetical protein
VFGNKTNKSFTKLVNKTSLSNCTEKLPEKKCFEFKNKVYIIEMYIKLCKYIGR